MGYLWAVTAALCWALIGPLGTYCMRAGLSPQEVAFWRALFGSMFFIAHALFFHMRVKLRTGLIFAAFGLVGVGLFFSTYQIAVREAGSALAAVLLYTAPAWVALFSRLLFKETLDGPRIVALILAMAGAALVCASGGGLPARVGAFGITCGLASGFCYSLHYVFTRKFLGAYPAALLYACCMPVGALTLLPFVDFAPKSGSLWLVLILCIGFLTCYAAYLAYCAAMRRLSSTRVAVLATLEPVAAAFFAAIWWGERLNGLGLAGAGLVLIGALCAVLARGKRAGTAS